jgi:HPt (histidine-containing phosphotransfer) domain-containing protein
MTGDHEKSLAAGMVDHVTKPIDPGHLFTTLQKWIQPREAALEEAEPVPAADDHQPLTAASGTAEASATAPQVDDLSFPTSLAGFDLDEGLERLQGNHKLYKKLLVNFAGSYAGATDDIRRALASADYEQAHQLVHSLKGVAANLAAGPLLKTTVELEKLVKHVAPDAPPDPETIDIRLDALNTALGQALRSVDTLKADDGDINTQRSAITSAPIPVDIDKAAIDRLREAAEMGDVTEVVSIVEKIALQAKGFSPYKEKIAQLADDFDFDAILQLADQLENQEDGAAS